MTSQQNIKRKRCSAKNYDGDKKLSTGNTEKQLIVENYDSDYEETIYLKDNHLYYLDDVELGKVSKVKRLMNKYFDEITEISNMKYSINFTPKPLYLHITSYGGDLISGLMLYDFIQEYSLHVPVYTVVEGIAASAATLISLSGQKRYITPNSYLLIHQLSHFFGGTYSKIKDETKNCDKMMNQIKKIYLEKSKLTIKKLEQLLKKDIQLDANKSKKLGLVDEIKTIDIFND